MIEICQVWRPGSDKTYVYIQFDCKDNEMPLLRKLLTPGCRLISEDINSVTVVVEDGGI